jgi:glycosyltransferase involved in cell wall biosynthesis
MSCVAKVLRLVRILPDDPTRLRLASATVDAAGIPFAGPRLSIIVNNHNYGRYLRASVESALAVTWPDREVVVVDDGSTDDSRQVLARLTAEHPDLKVHLQPNAGQAAAMNAGFALSTGDVVMFLDSDDMLDPGVAVVVVPALGEGVACAHFLLRTIDAAGEAIGLHPFVHTLEDGDVFRSLAAAGSYRFMPTSANVFRRRAVERLMPIPVDAWRICADTFLVCAAAMSGRVATVPHVLGSYRIHGANAWYAREDGPERSREVARNHRRLRSQLRRLLADNLDGWALARGFDGHTVLALVRRETEGIIAAPAGTFGRSEVRGFRWRLAVAALRAPAPSGERLLHAGLAMLVGQGRWRLGRLGARLVARPRRPALVQRLIVALAAPGRLDWLKAPIPGLPPLTPLGQTLELGRGDAGRALLWQGFDLAHPTVAWANAGAARLALALPEGPLPMTLSLELVPRLMPPAVIAQRVVVRANGRRVAQGRLSEDGPIEVLIDERVLAAAGEAGSRTVVLDLELPDAIAPVLLGQGSRECRPASVGLRSLRLIGAAPVHVPVVAIGDRLAAGARGRVHPAFSEGWQPVGGPGATLAGHEGRVTFMLPDAASRRFVILLDFARVDLPGGGWPVMVSAPGMGSDAIDLGLTGTAAIIVPRGAAPPDGRIELVVESRVRLPRLAPPGVRGGIVLRSVRLEPFAPDAPCAVFKPATRLDFTKGGNGRPFLESGWHEPDLAGTWSAARIAVLLGMWFEREREAFVTLVLSTREDVPDLARQTVEVVVEGCVLARQLLEPGRNEVFAIVPAGLRAAPGQLRLEFRGEALACPFDLARAAEPRVVGIRLEECLLEA